MQAIDFPLEGVFRFMRKQGLLPELNLLKEKKQATSKGFLMFGVLLMLMETLNSALYL